jgi:hypothetical protein
MDADRLSRDDDVYAAAKVAARRIQNILSDFPPSWQMAILKALGARMMVLRELQQEQPPKASA